MARPYLAMTAALAVKMTEFDGPRLTRWPTSSTACPGWTPSNRTPILIFYSLPRLRFLALDPTKVRVVFHQNNSDAAFEQLVRLTRAWRGHS